MPKPCAGCGKRTPNFVQIGADTHHVCNQACFATSQKPRYAALSESERATAQPLAPAQRSRLVGVPADVPVMAYVPHRQTTVPIGVEGPTIYLQARRLPDGTLVIDRFDNYTSEGHGWRTALVRAVPTRTAPQAVHAVPPPPAPAPTPTPALALSAPITVAATKPIHRIVRPRGHALACGHSTVDAVSWPGTASEAPRDFCGAECAARMLGAPVRLVDSIQAELIAAGERNGTWLTLPADSPLLRAYVHHPQTHASPS